MFDNLEKICRDHMNKRKFLKTLKSHLMTKHPSYRSDFNLVIMRLHNCLEDVFDRIIRSYIRPKQKDEWMYSDEVINSLNAKLLPEDVRNYIVFNLSFFEKKNLIHKLFGITKSTREFIEILNCMRNAIAHRYAEDDVRFCYKKQNILQNYVTLKIFITDYFHVLGEILKIDTKLLDALDKAEKALD